MLHNHYFILTGAMGSGKSTILEALASLNCPTVEEPARQIIAEQRAIGGEGLYDQNPRLFAELMLSRSIQTYHDHQVYQKPIIFDRGIPDNVAYFQWFELEDAWAKRASQLFRYNPRVFVTPSWKEIYSQDEERTISFEQAQAFAERSYDIYKSFGYTLYEVPKTSVEERAAWILKHINTWTR